MAPCRSCVNRRFGGIYRLQIPAHDGSSLADFSTLKMEAMSPKRWFIQDLHGAISQKTAVFIAKAVKTSTLTSSVLVQCTDKQHAMSSHELQSALMLTVEFSKMYYTR
jgi:hypothetical protein